jgi:hypothetical protein
MRLRGYIYGLAHIAIVHHIGQGLVPFVPIRLLVMDLHHDGLATTKAYEVFAHGNTVASTTTSRSGVADWPVPVGFHLNFHVPTSLRSTRTR